MELHKILSVSETEEVGVYISSVDITDKNGERYVTDYVSRPDDDYGLAPTIRSKIDQWITDGKPVAPYEPPTPEEIREMMPPLQKWRFETVIALEGLKDDIDTAIENLPEPQKTIAKNKREFVPEFYRTDPLFDLLGSLIGKTPEEIDTLWEQALTLGE